MTAIIRNLDIKKIVFSLGIISVVIAGIVASTGAFFSDSETSAGNIFTAGSIDLKVDHTYASYNGYECVGVCEEGGLNLIVNGGFETPVVTDNSGQWQVYPNGTQTSWDVVSGAGLELQRNSVEGAPHGGVQLAELDSTNQSAVQQIIATVPGQKYRLAFWHSPRPSNNSGDNAIDYRIEVTSNSGTIVDDTVEVASAGGGNTSWTLTTYNFIALDTQTTVRFSDTGLDNDSYGGYIDDVSVYELNCVENSYPYGGICTLWGEKDLVQGDIFWNFPDVKPGDYGTDVISLHVYSNDAYACLFPINLEDDENGVVDPELGAGDDLLLGVPNGELSGELEFFAWNDANNNGVHDSGETIFVDAGTPFSTIQSQMIAMSLTGNAPIDFIAYSWCAGEQTGPTVALPNTALSCDGTGMGNIAQTDKVMADFVAYAIQQRNNDGFQCDSIDPETLEVVVVPD